MGNNLPDQIRELVKQNELKQAAELLSNSSKAKKGIIQSSRLEDLSKKIHHGLIRFEDQNLETNNIRNALLEAAEELEAIENGPIKHKGWLISAIISIIVLVLCGSIFWITSPHCEYNSKYTVAIADFTLGEGRPFSGELIGNLGEELRIVSMIDSVRIKGLYKYIEHDLEKIDQKVQRIEKDNCISQGLLVYGKLLKDYKMLSCYIRLINMQPTRIGLKTEEKVRITQKTLKVPDEFEFILSDKVQKVRDFISGILNYYEGKPGQAIKYFYKAKEKTIIGKDPRYHNICNLLIGNCYQTLGESDSAITAYQRILTVDSTYTLAFWNITLAYLEINDNVSALQAFNKFYDLNEGQLTIDDQRVIRIFRPDKEFKGHLGKITSLTFSPDSKYILTTGDDKTALLRDTLGKKVNRFTNSEELHSSAIAPNGNYILLGSQNISTTLKLLDFTDFSLKNEIILQNNRKGNLPLFSSPKLSFSHDSEYFQYCDLFNLDDINNSILYDISGNEILNIYPFNILSISPTKNHFLCYKKTSNTIRIVDFEGQLLKEYKGDSLGLDYPFFSTFSQNGKYIFFANESTFQYSVLDISTGKLRKFQNYNRDLITSYDLSINGEYILVASMFDNIKIWDINGEEIYKIITDANVMITDASFSPDGKYIAIGGDNGNLRVWDFENILKDLDKIRY